ncbi:hypothetical protein [Halorhabdus tiamatea]|nr:hypothetical protein [Halorhabdus tiamatea]
MVTAIKSGGDHTTQLDQSDNSSIRTEPPSEAVGGRLWVHSFDDGSSSATFNVRVDYPARSQAEAEAARNGSFNPDWYDGQQRVQRIFQQTADEEDSLEHVTNKSRLVSTNYYTDEVTEAEYGWVELRTEVTWDNYVEPGEDLVIGPAYHRSLANSSTGAAWTLEVNVHESWEPSVVNGEPHTQPVGHVLWGYTWENVTSQTGTLLAFDSPITETTTDASGPFGLAGGTVLTGIAILIAGFLKGSFT